MCPELGKAVYFLVLDSQQFDAGLAEADAAATKITTQIGQKLGMVGTEAQAAGAEVGAAGTEMAAGFQKAGGAAATAGTETKAGAAEMVTAARGAAVGTESAAVASTSAWGKMGTSIGAMGTKSFGTWKLAGLAAIYEVAKGGISWLKETNAGTLQFNAALKATHDVAGTSTQALLHFSDSANSLATVGGRAAVLQMQKILLGFTNIRNEGAGAAAIFNRVERAAEDISARTGRSVTTVAVALGKAFQDPVKYMNTLGRAGVTFNKQQQQIVAGLIAQGKPLQAQQYMLQLLGRYTGSAAAQTQSFSGQLAVAKGHLAESSALMVHSFIPAFKTFVRILEVVAGYLAKHTTLVKDVTLAYLAWKGVMLVVGIGMKIFNSSLFQAAAGWLGFGRAAQTSAAEANAATVSMDESMGTLIGEVRILQRALMSIGPAAAEGSGAAILSLKGVNTALGTTAVVGKEAGVGISTGMIGATEEIGVARGALGGLAKGLFALGGTIFTIGVILSIIPKSNLGQSQLDKIGLGFLGRIPLLGKVAQWGADAGYHTRQGLDSLAPGVFGPTDSAYAKQQRNAQMRQFNLTHPKMPSFALWKITSHGTRAEYNAEKKMTDALRKQQLKQFERQNHMISTPFERWQQTHPGGTRAQYEADKKAQAAINRALNPQNFTQGADVLGSLTGPAWQKLQIAGDRAALTKTTADDKRVLTQEYDFLNHLLKTRKLSLDQKKTILDQMVTIHNSLMSLNTKIASAASPTLTKLLGPKWQQLDVQEQKAKQSGNLQKDKKALANEEDFIKGLLKNRQLSLASRQKLEHQLTAVEDKIKAINRKMASNAKSSQVSEMESFNELQGTFFGQFAPNIFGSSPAGLTLGSQRVKQPVGSQKVKQPVPRHSRVQHHAMGGVIRYARGGAVDMNYVREAPHYASHEARFHRAGLAYFSANSPTKERRGTDTVPAMLTPGELVLNRDQQRLLRSRLGMPRSGSANELFSAIQHGENKNDSALVLRLAHHQLSMERGGSRAPYRSDISTWLRQFQGMSKAQRSSAQDWWGTNYGEIRRGYASGGAVRNGPRGVHHTHTHVHKYEPPIKSYVPPRGSLSYIQSEARRMGLDVNAVMGVASGEGLGGGIGDRGTSFGPWQLHRGGALPRWAPQGEMAAQRWAWSRAGINYALQRMRAVARGLHGQRAAMAIINRFERPANPMSDYNAYLTYVGSHGMSGPVMRRGNLSSPFSRNSVFERIDQGVDYLVKGAVHAIGAGKITAITGGMAGGTGQIVKERLNRPIKISGRTYYGVYYSEGAAMAKAGQRVRAGQAVMGGGGVEIGFLNSKMQMPPLRGGLGAGTKPDQAGFDFLTLVSNLRTGRRVGMPPIFGSRRAVRHGNHWLMVPDAAGGGPMNPFFPDVGGISGLVPQTAPATTATDSVPAMLTPGEMVLNQSQQELLRQKLGLQALNSPQQLFSSLMNPQHYAKGGIVLRRSGLHVPAHARHHSGLFGGLAKAITGGTRAATSATHYVGQQSPAAIHHATDHSSPHPYYVPTARGMVPVSHTEYQSWHKKNVVRPDAGFSLLGALGHQFSPALHTIERVGGGAASFGYNVAKSTAMLANQAVNPHNAGLDFLKANLALTLTGDPRPMLHWLTEGYGGKQGAGAQWSEFIKHPVRSYKDTTRGKFGRSAQMDALFSRSLTKGQYEFVKGAVTHPLRNPQNTALLLAMMATPWMRRLGPALPEVDYGTNLRGAALSKALSIGLRVHHDMSAFREHPGQRRAGLGIVGGPRSIRDQLAHEAYKYLGVRDAFRALGHDPFAIRPAGPFTKRPDESFTAAVGHELSAHAALARDVGRTMHPREWPNWVRNQLRNQGLLDKYTRRWGGTAGGLGIVNSRTANSVWKDSVRAHDLALAAGAKSGWSIPDPMIFRGGSPIKAIQYTQNLAREHRYLGPWYDAVGLTLGDISHIEQFPVEPYVGAFSLLSPRALLTKNLEWAVLASRIASKRDLIPADLRAMKAGLPVWMAQVPRINQLFREGAHGIGNKKLGIGGDIMFSGGMKVPSFNHNLLQSIFGHERFPGDHVTVDVTAADALIPGAKDLINMNKHYLFLAQIYRQIANREGMLGKEAQASVWVPHRISMRSTARGGVGALSRENVLRSASDFLSFFGDQYGGAAKARLIQKIEKTGYGHGGGLGIVSSHDRAASLTPISESYNAGIAQIMESMGGGGALNAGVYRVLFNDQTQGVIKFFKRRDRLVNELLATQVGRAVGAYLPDMAQIDEHAVAMRVAEGKSAQTHGWEGMSELDLAQSRAGQRLGLLDNLIGNTDRHLGNVIGGAKGPIAIDNELSFGYGWGPSGGSRFGMGGGAFAPEFDPKGLTPADITHLDEELQKLRPNFSRLGREHSWRGVMSNWADLKNTAFGARAGDSLTKLHPAEYEPFLGGSVSPTESISPNVLDQLRSLIQEGGYSAAGRSESYRPGSSYTWNPGFGEWERRPTRHFPAPGYRWDSGEGLYRHTSGWTWTSEMREYRRRSQITPPFTAGNRQIFGMGQNTRDIFHALIDRFSPGDPNRMLAERAYRAAKIYPKGRIAGSVPRGIEAGYHDVMANLASIRGADVPHDLFMTGVRGEDHVNAARQRGLSGLVERLHERYHYPLEMKNPNFERRGGVPDTLARIMGQMESLGVIPKTRGLSQITDVFQHRPSFNGMLAALRDARANGRGLGDRPAARSILRRINEGPIPFSPDMESILRNPDISLGSVQRRLREREGWPQADVHRFPTGGGLGIVSGGARKPQQNVRFAFEAASAIKPWQDQLSPRQRYHYMNQASKGVLHSFQGAGLPARLVDQGVGFWVTAARQLETNRQAAIEMPVPDMRLSPKQENFYQAIAATMAHHLGQEGVGWMQPFSTKAKTDATAWRVNLERKLSQPEMRKLGTSLDPEHYYISSTDKGFIVARTGEDAAAHLNKTGKVRTASYRAALNHVSSVIDTAFGDGAFDNLNADGKIRAFAQRGGYAPGAASLFRAALGRAGRSDLLHRLDLLLGQEVGRVDERYRRVSDIPHFSTGGSVTGSGTGDTVSAMLTPGEIVFNSAQQVLLRQRLGLASLGSPTQLFNEIAARHYAAGGIVEGLDLAQHGQPAIYSTATPSLGYAQKRDIARLVGIESRARELYANTDRGHTLHYEQNNHYSELPKDPFEEARQMKQAVHASFLT